MLGAPNQDVAFVSLGYPGGVIGHVHVSWVEAQKIREVVVVGGERRIVFNDLDPLERVRVFEKGVVRSAGAGAAPGSRFELHDGADREPGRRAVRAARQPADALPELHRDGPPAADGRAPGPRGRAA